MTEAEALRIVANPHLKWKCVEVDSALTIVKNALKKQTAEKVIVWADNTEHCPYCEKDLTALGYLKHCSDCGQKLDWSEV